MNDKTVVNSELGTENAESVSGSATVVNAEVTNEQNGSATTVNAELVNAQPDEENTESTGGSATTVNAELVNAEVVNEQNGSATTVNAELVNAEVVNEQNGSATTVNAELVNAEVVNEQNGSATTVNAELVNAEVTNEQNGSATIVNAELGKVHTENETADSAQLGNATAVNIELGTAEHGIIPGTVICDGYEIVRPLSLSTGEADLYVCKYNGNEYVAKIYRRQRAIKPEVISALKAINSPYVASLYETGEYNGFPFEILPYYKNGSLQGKRFSFEELKSKIIPCLNEALHILHLNDIIHKDFKPSNIMLLNDDEGVAVIDFGISSVVEQGSTVIVTKTGMTPEYSGPETFRNLFLEESDYYSLGITLYELFCGCTPYHSMSAEKIAQYTAVQRIPFPDNMPSELRDLISGVTYFDITNRNNKDNPNRRWTYEEVKNWCEGKKQVIPGEGVGVVTDNSIPDYHFLNNIYKDVPTLVTALANNWSEGKKQLYRGHLSAFFKTFNPRIYLYCSEAEKEASESVDKDDIIFFRLLYKIYPELSGFYWMGQIYESLPALGRDILERLWNKDTTNRAYWDSILSNKLLTSYLSEVRTENSELYEASDALETAHAVISRTDRDSMMNYYTMAYLLSGQKLYAVGDKRIKSVPELTAYMQSLLDCSYSELERFCHSIVDYTDNLDVQLEAWLLAIGKREEIEAWRAQLSR